MTRSKTPYPIESFGPELMAFLTKAGRERVVLKFVGSRGRATAHTFVRRVYTLRSRMRQEQHPDYRFAVRAKVSVLIGESAVAVGAPREWSEDFHGNLGAVVLGVPHDMEFRDVLTKAMVHVEDKDPPPLQEKPTPEDARFGSLLGELEQMLDQPLEHPEHPAERPAKENGEDAK